MFFSGARKNTVSILFHVENIVEKKIKKKKEEKMPPMLYSLVFQREKVYLENDTSHTGS